MTGKTLTAKEQREWHASVILALPHDIDPDKVRIFNRDRTALAAALRSGLMPTAKPKEQAAPAPAPPASADVFFEEADPPKHLAAIEHFDAAHGFRKEGDNDLPVHSLCENFARDFFGVVAEDVPAMTVRQRKLLKQFSPDMLAVLGDENPERIEKLCMPLAQARHFLLTADQTRWYLFFVPDVNGKVRLMRAKIKRGEQDRRGWALESKDPASVAFFRAAAGDYLVAP